MVSKYLRLLAVLAVGGVAIVAAGCGDDDGSGVREVGNGSASGSGSGAARGSGSGSATGSAEAECMPVGDISQADVTVNLTLDEWVIEAGEPTVSSGSVGFAAENVGEEPHEVVVLSGVEPDALPLDDDGALDEEALPSGALIGEIEPFASGETCDGVFDLEPGEYTLICNISEIEPDGTVESHLAEGMLTTFTVE